MIKPHTLFHPPTPKKKKLKETPRFTPNNTHTHTHTHTQKKKKTYKLYRKLDIIYIYIDYMTVLFPGMCFLQNKSMATSNIRLFPSHTGATNRLLHGIMTPQYTTNHTSGDGGWVAAVVQAIRKHVWGKPKCWEFYG